ncbi:MAG: anthranilate phosphoribosyltransferase [Actinobacteria bacterium]|uniref:anthranilate phosphoribosyltransferase n=1 Tax=freshwater metagenome TaxID=449393 RepID=A0A6J6LJN0_9ZZZZ|nr:anthranilate phosphoribosyltransferase [Actinomycetota bacterium]
MAHSPEFIGWPTLLGHLLERRDLDSSQAEAAITQILNGSATPSQMTAFIIAMRAKGETTEELEGMLHAVRSAGMKVHLDADVASRAIDIVGTGGDKSSTVNVSTMSALVVAAAGVPVCKHGNRAASSQCGAADLLEAAGVAIELDPQGVEASIAATGFGFCLAAQFHPAFRYTGPSRREIGVPTAFNLLGPMANPAPISNMLVGVAMPNMMEAMVGALASRNVTSAWVVHGHEGLDELAVSGPNIVYELRDGNISRFEIDAADFGITHSTLADVRGGDAQENLAIMNKVFAGGTGAVRDIVSFNAGCALFVARHVASVADGIDVARATIDSGAAATMLSKVVAVSTAEAVRMRV